MKSDFVAVADESGTHAAAPCYTIGALILPSYEFDLHTRALQAILDRHDITDEIKWTKIGSFRRRNEAAIEGVEYFLESGAQFSAIVVKKIGFKKWEADHEDGFYHAYYELAKHLASKHLGTIELRMDERQDHYDKQHEVMGIITNHVLARRSIPSSLVSVEKLDSKDHVVLQVADILTGAINSSTASYRADSKMNGDKADMIDQISGLVGWDSLHYDTYPSKIFNVWHFPLGTRGPTKKTIFDP